MTSSRGIKATETIIKHLEKIDKPPEQEAKVKEENEETFGDISLFDVTKDDDEVGNSKINFDTTFWYNTNVMLMTLFFIRTQLSTRTMRRTEDLTNLPTHTLPMKASTKCFWAVL